MMIPWHTYTNTFTCSFLPIFVFQSQEALYLFATEFLAKCKLFLFERLKGFSWSVPCNPTAKVGRAFAPSHCRWPILVWAVDIAIKVEFVPALTWFVKPSLQTKCPSARHRTPSKMVKSSIQITHESAVTLCRKLLSCCWIHSGSGRPSYATLTFSSSAFNPATNVSCTWWRAWSSFCLWSADAWRASVRCFSSCCHAQEILRCVSSSCLQVSLVLLMFIQ